MTSFAASREQSTHLFTKIIKCYLLPRRRQHNKKSKQTDNKTNKTTTTTTTAQKSFEGLRTVPDSLDKHRTISSHRTIQETDTFISFQ